MFYSQDILQRRGGKFGVIWIAATKATNLTKRDYCTVNIKKTCEDLLLYIMSQAQPLRPGAPRPRFSLYLSSQLMYGIVRVYDRQQQYLFSDASSLSSKFHLVAAPILEIDLQTLHRPDFVNMVDVVDTFRRASDVPAEDPCFGLLKSIDMPDWQLIPDVAVWRPPTPHMELLLPDLSRKDIVLPSSPHTPGQPFHPVFGSIHQVAPETITMLEEPLTHMDTLQVPGGQDLPPLQDYDLNNLNQPQDQPSTDTLPDMFSPRTARPSSPHTSPHTRTDAQTDVQTSREELFLDPLNLEQQLDQGRLEAAEETPMVFPELDMLAAPQLPAPVISSPHLTPSTPPLDRDARRKRRASLYEMELSEPDVISSASGRRRRRQLFIYDSELQLSRKQVREQLEQGHMTSETFEPAGRPMPSAKQLLGRPTRPALQHGRLLHLWTRNAMSRDFPDTESDEGRPAWTVPGLILSGSLSGSDRVSPRNLPLTLGEPPLSPVLEVAEQPRAELDSVVHDTMEVLRRSNLEQSEHGHITPHLGHVSLGTSMKDQSLLSERDVTTSFRRDSERRASSRTRRKTAQDPDKSSSSDLTLTEEVMDVRPPEDLATVHEVAEEQLISPTHPERSPRAEHSPPTEGGSPSKRRRIQLEEEMEERMMSPAHRRLISHISAETSTNSFTTFVAVCPLTYTSHQAARMFSALLNYAAVQKISVQQEEPYGEIYIMRGIGWLQH